MVWSSGNGISVQSPAANRPGYAASRLAALPVLLIAAIPGLLTAAAVLWSIGRPILFRQERSGLGGVPFTLIKFRTMHDWRDADGRLLPDAARVTALGRFIRRVRLDEIPQLLAILAGEMAFVGPRPLQPATVAAFRSAGELRGKVRPGLTGWAQVNGNTRLTDRQKLALDIWYVDHRSVTLDIWILLLTVVTIVFGERIREQPLARAEAHFSARFGTRKPTMRMEGRWLP